MHNTQQHVFEFIKNRLVFFAWCYRVLLPHHYKELLERTWKSVYWFSKYCCCMVTRKF